MPRPLQKLSWISGEIIDAPGISIPTSSDGLLNIEKMFKATKELPPEKNLMIAILQESIRGLTCDDAELLVESEEWFASDDDEYIFDFVSICETLGFDPDWMRREINDPSRVQRWARRRRVPRGVPVPKKPKRGYRELRADIHDIPGRTYTHEYGACPTWQQISKCVECKERYQYSYKRANPDTRMCLARRIGKKQREKTV